jgi:hypothetical protein
MLLKEVASVNAATITTTTTNNNNKIRQLFLVYLKRVTYYIKFGVSQTHTYL